MIAMTKPQATDQGASRAGGRSRWTSAVWTSLLICASAVSLPAQTLTTLLNFNGATGSSPGYGALVQGTDGNFYGTTEEGGVSGFGTVFRVTANGTLTTLYSFCSQSGCTDGSTPYAGLIQASDGNFYGTTQYGGAGQAANTNGYGTVFRITPAGTQATLYSFCSQPVCTDGGGPVGGVIQAKDGNFYGITTNGGANGDGSVFRMTPAGMLTTLYSFCSQAQCADGMAPLGGLIQASDGNLYGTTSAGGYVAPDPAGGTVFRITTAGTLTTLQTFYGNDEGVFPYGRLIQASDGFLYGTTNQGGSHGNGAVFRISLNGATLTTLYSFGNADANNPYAGLVQATDGNFYGTAPTGASGYGAVFRITPGGTMTTLHSFCSQAGCADGSYPFAGLIQASDGNLYGTTLAGGASGQGTIYKLALNIPTIASGGIVPVYSTVPTVQTGEWVSIYGSGLAGSMTTWNGNFPMSLGGTSVTIDGKPAFLWYVSPGQINLQVPADSTLGTVPVVVTTANGTSSSTVTLAQFAPSFSLLDNRHVAGIILRSDGSGAYGGGAWDIIGPTGNSLGYPTVAAKAGDSLELFAVGLGPTSPVVPAGQAFSGSAPTTFSVSLLINKVNVIPTSAGLSGAFAPRRWR